MIDFYLITGFLGAGKTTFLKNFVRLFEGRKISIIVNEFGSVSVDSVFLSKLKLKLSEVHNGSIFCACRLEQFEKALLEIIKEKPDIVIVETSGLSDPTNIKKILSDKEKYSSVSYKGCICLVDALQFIKVYNTASVVKKQLNVSDAVIINKTDLVTVDAVEKITAILSESLPHGNIFKTENAEISLFSNQLQSLESRDVSPVPNFKDVTLQSYIVNVKDNIEYSVLISILKTVAKSSYRIKGFVNSEGRVLKIDTAGEEVNIEKWDKDTSLQNKLVVLSCGNLFPDKALKEVSEKYKDGIVSID